MKGIIIALISVALILCMALPCLAAGTEPQAAEGEFNMENYLTEKIAPILAGVATSLVALFGGLSKIKSAVNGLDKSGKELSDIKEAVKSTLSDFERQLKDGIADIEAKISAVPEIKEGYDEIKRSCEELKEQSKSLGEALRLGFEAIPEAVKCGNARKISILTNPEPSKEAE